jgi:ribosomal protein L11
MFWLLRSAALPEKVGAYAKKVAETVRAKLQAQLENAGFAMASSLGQLAVNIKATVGDMEECTKFFANIMVPDDMNKSQAQVLGFCESNSAKQLYEQMAELHNIDSEQEMLISKVQEAFSADPAAALHFQKVIESVRDQFGKVKDAELATLRSGGQLLGNLTAAQALVRQLKASESRAILAKKALKGLKRKNHLRCEPLLKQMLEEAAPSAGTPLPAPA